MNQLQNVFDYNGRDVRTVVDESGEVWFVAKDVCEALEISNVSLAINGNPSRVETGGLDDDEKGVFSVNTLGGIQELLCVTESGLYSLVFKSRKAEAKKFKRWVTHEVLPSIRKHGMYATDELLDNPDLLIQVATKLKEEREKRIAAETKNLMLEQRVAEYEPKATYVDQILKSQDVVTITQIAKDYGLSGRVMNKILHEQGVQYKMGGQWLLYQKHQDKGYTKSRTHDYKRSNGEAGVKMDTRWTQKGRLFIHDILTRLGYVPEIEKEVVYI